MFNTKSSIIANCRNLVGLEMNCYAPCVLGLFGWKSQAGGPASLSRKHNEINGT